ncbi:MAG: hypothetical protein AMXMBFR84_10430 [Candidatus Hydrogenedentota bacterium]
MPPRPSRKPLLRQVFEIRGLLMVPPVLLMALCFSYEFEQDYIVWPLGFAVFLCGLALRIWAQTHLHYRLRVRKELTETGPYAYVRNPIYIGNTLILMSLCIMSELLWFMPVLLAWIALVYSLVVRYEEQHLTEKYGDPYRQFLARVPRWIPRLPLRPFVKTLSARQYLKASIVAELHCFLWILPFALKEIVSDYWLPGHLS